MFAALLTAIVAVQAPQTAAPRADYHQHLFSPAFVAMLTSGGQGPAPITAADLIALLDSAGIGRAIVLSVAYSYGSPTRTVDDEYAKVRAENDWTAAQAALYPERLRAFCSFNPLEDYALAELERCADHPGLRHGIKLHFGNSDVRLDSAAHVDRLRRVFAAANERRMALVVHLRAHTSRGGPYGARQARAFLEQVLPAAPDVPVQIAHLAGAGGFDEPGVDSALAVFAEAIARGDRRTARLWFDLTTVARVDMSPNAAAHLATRIRQLGMGRVLYGSDAAAGGNLRPREAWAAFLKLPLTEAEFATIAGNATPYLP
jgi:predicted TIM-barrel fold metal-dependent hydrolase